MKSPIWIPILLWLLICGCRTGPHGAGPTPGPDIGVSKLIIAITGDGGAPVAGCSVYFGGSLYTSGSDGKVDIGTIAQGDYEVAADSPDYLYFSTTANIPRGDYTLAVTLERSSQEFKVERVVPGLGLASPEESGRFIITFTQPVDASAFTSDDMTFVPAVGNFGVTVDGKTAVLDFTSEWPANQTVRWKLARTVQSTAGDELPGGYLGQFRVSAIDRTRPRLVSSKPSQNEENVFRNQAIELGFSDLIDPLSLNLAHIEITPSIELSPRVDGQRIVLSHDALFDPSTTYSVALSGVTDKNGNLLLDPVALEFTTGTEVRRFQYLEPDWTRVGDRIIFASNEGGSFDLWQIKPDGTGLTALSTDSGDELHPRYSYDGSQAVFEKQLNGYWQVFRLDIASGQIVQVTTGNDNFRSPVYSPTYERRLTYLSDRNDRWDLWVSEEDGSVPRQWLSSFGRGPADPDYHPFLETQIVFSADGGVSRDIFKISGQPGDPDTTYENLTNELASDESSPAYSPEGDVICFVSDAGGVHNLWLTDANGEFPRQLTNETVNLDHPVFSPNFGEPRILAEVHREDGTVALAFFDAVGGELTGYLLGGSE